MIVRLRRSVPFTEREFREKFRSGDVVVCDAGRNSRTSGIIWVMALLYGEDTAVLKQKAFHEWKSEMTKILFVQ